MNLLDKSKIDEVAQTLLDACKNDTEMKYLNKTYKAGKSINDINIYGYCYPISATMNHTFEDILMIRRTEVKPYHFFNINIETCEVLDLTDGQFKKDYACEKFTGIIPKIKICYLYNTKFSPRPDYRILARTLFNDVLAEKYGLEKWIEKKRN